LPYIPQAERNDLAPHANRIANDPGELNFQITCIINGYLAAKPLKYARLNDAVGALECAKLELYRRIAAPYESSKILENGEVYTCRSKLPKGYI
jgi:hypothetical protein